MATSDKYIDFILDVGNCEQSQGNIYSLLLFLWLHLFTDQTYDFWFKTIKLQFFNC